jgi:hypothetical protein
MFLYILLLILSILLNKKKKSNKRNKYTYIYRKNNVFNKNNSEAGFSFKEYIKGIPLFNLIDLLFII